MKLQVNEKFQSYTASLNSHSHSLAALFLRLTKAYELLQDPIKRSAYDEEYKAKLARKRRMDEMDRQRKLDREKLELREYQAKRSKSDKMAEAAVGVEIERQREENSRRLRDLQRETIALASDIKKQAQQEETRSLLDEPVS